MLSKRKSWRLVLFMAIVGVSSSGYGERKPLSELTIPFEPSHYFRDVGPNRVEVIYDSTEGGLYRFFVDGEEAGIYRMDTTKVEVVVEARVDFDSKKGDYKYYYTFHNRRDPLQKLADFCVHADLNRVSIDEVSEPPDWRHGRFGRDRPSTTWMWEKPRPLSRGESLEGFFFTSPVLPSIVECSAGSERENPFRYTKCAYDEAGLYPMNVYHSGNTVGPVAPPEEFDPQEFLEHLTWMIDENLREGWIEAEGVAKEFQKRLQLAREAIQDEDSKRLESILKAFLEVVEKEKERSLLSEAYALLKFNLQYWLDQLSNGQK